MKNFQILKRNRFKKKSWRVGESGDYGDHVRVKGESGDHEDHVKKEGDCGDDGVMEGIAMGNRNSGKGKVERGKRWRL